MEPFKMSDQEFSFETEILKQGAYINSLASNPESAPIYLTTAFNVEDLEDLYDRYEQKGFCYNRNRNPNRNALIDLISYAEAGEASIICSSGMGAISTTILSMVKSGDHIVSDMTLYGETIDIFKEILPNYGIEITFVDFTKLEEVEKAIRPKTRILFTETVSNPMITVVDIGAVAALAHKNNSLLVVDNTFMTSVACRPIKLGADLVINSLTKFANGHSDAVCGSVTGKAELIGQAYRYQVLLGNAGDAFTAWLVQRGMRTMSLRVEKQMENAAKLANALERSPFVQKVFHPSLTSHPQHELAMKQFGSENLCGGMLSIVLPDSMEKLNLFMRKLNLAHYAMTLGGYRTTLAHPVSSSHYDMPEEERVKIGITFGLIRISVGIEKAEDLIQDFLEALSIYAE